MCVPISPRDRERLAAFESAYETFQAAHEAAGRQYGKEVGDSLTKYQRAAYDAAQAADPAAALRAADDQYRESLRVAAESTSKAVETSFRTYVEETSGAFSSAGRHFENPSALTVVSQSLMLVASQAAPWAGTSDAETKAPGPSKSK